MQTKTRLSGAPHSLTSTLALAFAGLSLLVLLVAGILQLLFAIQTQQVSVANQQQLIAEDASRTVSSFLQERLNILTTTAKVADPGSASPQVARQDLQSLLGLESAFRQAVLLNSRYRELASVSRLPEQSVASITTRINSDAIDHIQQGKTYISPVYIDPESSEPLVVMAVPVNDALGESQGILAAEVNLKFMWDLVDRLKVGDTGSAYVVDKTGKLLAFRDTSRVLKGESVATTPEVNEFIQGTRVEPLLGLAPGIEGTPTIGAFAPLGTPDWAIITELPWQEAYAPFIQNALSLLIATVALAVLAALAGIFLARRLAVPLINLTDTATRITAGQLSLQAPVQGTSEVVSLATAFNSMTTQLRQTFESLERRVAERTQELSNANLSLQSNSAYLSALSDTSAGLFERLDLTSLLQAIVERAGALMDTQNGFVFFAEPNEQEIQMRVGSGLYDDLVGTRAQPGVGLAGSVWQTGEPMVIEDYQKWEGRLPGSRRDALHAILAVPLKRGIRQVGDTEDTIGVIGLAYTDPARKFGKPEVGILQRFAQLASIALDNAELYANSENRVQELGALNTISQLIVQPYNASDVVVQIGEQIRNTFDADFGYFAVLNTETNLIEFPYVVDEGKLIQIAPMPLDEGITAQVITTGQSFILSHASPQDYERLGAVDSGDGMSPHSLMAVPIRSGEAVLGALSVQRVAHDRPFTPSDQNLLMTIAANIGVGLQNVQLAQATQRRLAELAAVNTISTILTSDQALTTRLSKVGRELHTIFQVSSVYIALYDAASRQVRMPFFMGDEQEFSIEPYTLGPGFTSHIIQTREPLLINDGMDAQMQALHAMNAGDENASQSYLGVPMILGDAVLGAIGLSAVPKNKFQESDVRLLGTISSAIATAIQNTRLLEQTQERARELDAVNSLAREITQQRSLDDLFQEVYLQIKSVSVADGLLVSLYDDSTDTLTVPFLMDEGKRYDITPEALAFERSYVNQVRMGEPFMINNTPEEAAELDRSSAVAGGGRASRSRLYVPLMAGMRFLGMISLHSYEFNAYSERDVSVLSGLASYIAVALENARLFEQTQKALADTATQAQRLAHLNQASAGLAVATTFEQIVQISDSAAKEILNPDRVTFAMLVPDESSFQIYGLSGDVGVSPIGTLFKTEGSLLGDAIKTRRVVYARDLSQEYDTPSMRPLIQQGIRSIITAPFSARGRIIGSLNVSSKTQDAFTEGDVSLVVQLASLTGTTIEKQRLFEQTQDALSEANRLYRIAEAANLQVDDNAFYKQVHEITSGALPAKNFFIALYNADDTTMDMVYYVDDKDPLPEMPMRRLELGTGITAYVLRSHQPLMATKAEIQALAEQGKLELHGSEAEMWLGVPMMRGDVPIGVVAVQSYDPTVLYTERDKQTLTRLTQGIANAIERKLAEQALRSSQAQLSETMRLTRLGNWEYDVPTDTFTFNDEFYAMMRTAAEREGGYHMRSAAYAQRFLHPDDAALVGMEISKGIETTDPNFSGTLDHRVIFGNGEPGYITVTFRVVKNAQGQTVKTYGANLDITARKVVENALSETMRITRLGNWQYDVLKDIFTFNDEFYAMMRTTAAREGGYEMNAATYAQRFVYPEDAPLVGIEIGKAIQTTDPNFSAKLDHRVIFGDGALGYVTVTFRIIKDEAGQTVKTYGANLDITERKVAEQELQAALAETRRLAEQARESAEQVSSLNRRLTRDGWREYLGDFESGHVYRTGQDEIGNGHVTPSAANGGSQNGENGNGHDTVRVPIQLRGEVIGEIELEYDEAENGLSEDQQAIVTDVAEHLGIVLDNARLYQQSQVALDETRRLADREKRAAEISDRIYAATDVKTILRIAAEELRKTTGSARAVLQLGKEKNDK